jgi:hypothetical protein
VREMIGMFIGATLGALVGHILWSQLGQRSRMQPPVCNATLQGTSDRDDLVMGFNTFTIGEAHATPTANDSMLIPAGKACGPFRLRASMGSEASP